MGQSHGVYKPSKMRLKFDDKLRVYLSKHDTKAREAIFKMNIEADLHEEQHEAFGLREEWHDIYDVYVRMNKNRQQTVCIYKYSF